MDIEPTGILPAAAAAVTGAIRNAAQLTGASFQYLLATARVESRLNPQAAAPTSSARGPFQFVEQTWLATLKEQGPALGYGRYADAIVRQPNGRYEIAEPQLVEPILNLRFDPAASATLAGAFAKTNASKLTAWIGRPPTEGELYLAHFLGPSGAAKLIGYVETLPQTPAAQAFPIAANANPAIFYDREKKPRSVAEVYRVLVGRYDVARAAPAVAALQVANATPVAKPVAPAARAPAVAATAVMPTTPPVQPASLVLPNDGPPPDLTPAPIRDPVSPATAQVAKTYEDTARIAAAKVGDAIPVFHSLFHSVERPKPVSPTVSALWGAPSQPQPVAAPSPSTTPTAPTATAQTPAEKPAGTRGLFQDQAPDARALFRGGA